MNFTACEKSQTDSTTCLQMNRSTSSPYELIDTMPPLKQPGLLRDLAMDEIIKFFANFCDQSSTGGSLEKICQAIAIMKRDISPHIPLQMSVDFHEKFLDKFMLRPDYKLIERPDSDNRAVLELIMDRKIIGLRCTAGKLLASLDRRDAHRIKGLKELDLSFFKDIPEPYSIENFCLEDLTVLHFVHNCTDEALEAIGRNCRKLEVLNLAASYKITDRGLRGLSPCSELQALWLAMCVGVTYNGVKEFLSLHNKMQKFGSWHDDASAKDPSIWPSITSFSIGFDSGRVMSKHLRSATVKFPNLETMTLSGFLKGDLSILKSMSKLSKLDLRDVADLKWDNLDKLLTFVGPNITDLRLCCTNTWTGMTQRRLNFLGDYCGNIEHLEFYRVPDQRKEVLVVPPFPKLKELVCVVPYDYYDCHVDLVFGGTMPSLEKLMTCAVHVTNEGMESMILDSVKFPKLKAVVTDQVPIHRDFVRVPNEVPENYDVARMRKIARDNNLDIEIKDVTDY